MQAVSLFRQEVVLCEFSLEEALFVTRKWYWILGAGTLLGGLIIAFAIYCIENPIGLGPVDNWFAARSEKTGGVLITRRGFLSEEAQKDGVYERFLSRKPIVNRP